MGSEVYTLRINYFKMFAIATQKSVEAKIEVAAAMEERFSRNPFELETAFLRDPERSFEIIGRCNLQTLDLARRKEVGAKERESLCHESSTARLRIEEKKLQRESIEQLRLAVPDHADRSFFFDEDHSLLLLPKARALKFIAKLLLGEETAFEVFSAEPDRIERGEEIVEIAFFHGAEL